MQLWRERNHRNPIYRHSLKAGEKLREFLVQGEHHADCLEEKQEKRQRNHGPGCQMPGRVFGLAQAAKCQEQSLDWPRQPYARKSLWIAPGSHMPGTVFGLPQVAICQEQSLGSRMPWKSFWNRSRRQNLAVQVSKRTKTVSWGTPYLWS